MGMKGGKRKNKKKIGEIKRITEVERRKRRGRIRKGGK